MMLNISTEGMHVADLDTKAATQENNEFYISELGRAYAQGDLVLALGAGVSENSGYPGWNELIRQLELSILSDKYDISTLKCDPNDIVNIFNKIINPNPLIAARYIKSILSHDVNKRIWRQLYNGSRLIGNPTIETISELCSENPKKCRIDSIITYNFGHNLEIQ